MTQAELDIVFAPITADERRAMFDLIESYDSRLRDHAPHENSARARLRDSLSNSSLWKHHFDAIGRPKEPGGAPTDAIGLQPGSSWSQDITDWVATEYGEYEHTVEADDCAGKLSEVLRIGGDDVAADDWARVAIQKMGRRNYDQIPFLVHLSRALGNAPDVIAWGLE